MQARLSLQDVADATPSLAVARELGLIAHASSWSINVIPKLFR